MAKVAEALPPQVIVFSFSKRECEARALEMQLLDLTNDDEKKLIDSIYNRWGCQCPPITSHNILAKVWAVRF